MVTKAKPVDKREYRASSEDYYVRETEDDANLFGPLSLETAMDYTRRMSMLNDSGLGQVVTYLGARAGDPIVEPPVLFVVALFRRGKALVAGRPASYISKNRIPPAQ